MNSRELLSRAHLDSQPVQSTAVRTAVAVGAAVVLIAAAALLFHGSSNDSSWTYHGMIVEESDDTPFVGGVPGGISAIQGLGSDCAALGAEIEALRDAVATNEADPSLRQETDKWRVYIRYASDQYESAGC